MATTYPDLCPISRRYTPGKFATKRFNSISGASATRLYGSKHFDAEMDLEYLLNDEQLELVLECYNKAYGDYHSLAVPAEIFVGISDGVQKQLAASLNWRWKERPQIESVQPHLSRVRVSLIATLDI